MSPGVGSGAGPSLQSATREGRETSWILVLVDEELPTRAAVPRIFGGRGGVRAGKRGIDARNVEAFTSPPAARGDQGRRRPASMQLIHHQVLAPARAYTIPTYP